MLMVIVIVFVAVFEYMISPEVNVTWSVMASPRVVAFSTVKVDIVVELVRETVPVAVRELTNTSPSASTRCVSPKR